MSKICFVISDLNGGGAQKVLVAISNYFSSKKIDVLIITFDKGKSFFKINKNIEITSLNISKKSKNKFFGFFSNIYRVVKLRQLILKKNPNTVISFIFETNVLTIISLLFTKVRLVVSERNNPYYQKRSFIWNLARFFFYPLAHYVIVNNIFAKQYFSKFYNKKVKMINNPLETSNFSNKKKKIILVVSRLHEQKSIHLILIAFSKFLKTYANWKLEIIGVGKLEQQLKNLSIKLEINKKVDWIGEKKNIDKHYASASIFCLPSKYEGCSNALLEALSKNISCLVSSSAVSKDEIYYKYLSTFKTGNVQSLYKKLINIVKDENYINRKSDFGKLAEKHYSISKVSTDWLKLLNV